MSERYPSTREDLITHLKQMPFRPFVIVMVDGSRFEIVRRFQAAVGEKTGYLVPATGGAGHRFRLNDVKSVEQAAQV